jgi:hypothetical protein
VGVGDVVDMSGTDVGAEISEAEEEVVVEGIVW